MEYIKLIMRIGAKNDIFDLDFQNLDIARSIYFSKTIYIINYQYIIRHEYFLDYYSFVNSQGRFLLFRIMNFISQIGTYL